MMFYNSNCRGHTLIELLIAMTLSLLILAAVVPINSLGLKASQHQDKIIQITNQLRQSLKQFEFDIKSTAASGCLLDKTKILDLLFTQPISANNQLSHPWLMGRENDEWSPSSPFFDNSNIHNNSDAISLIYGVLIEELDTNNLILKPQRIFYITNCSIAEISRGINSTLDTISGTRVYALQSIIYYLREVDGSLILYRQYLSQNGNPRNEPLIDNLESLKIGYGEQTNTDTLVFKTANDVDHWDKIKVIYLQLQINIEGDSYTTSKLIELPNTHE